MAGNICRYNFPWSGRLGSPYNRCIYCGDSGMSFQISSRSDRCTRCHSKKEAIPKLKAEMDAAIDKAIRRWCKKRNIDYDATVAKCLDVLGPPTGDRPMPSGQVSDCIIYMPPAQQ